MVELAVRNGLEGVVVAETKISEVDGENGKLIIHGRDAEELGLNATFEETCALLWSDLDNKDKSSVSKLLGEARVKAFELVEKMPQLLIQPDPMDAVRTATSYLSGTTESTADAFASITGAVGVFAACWSRANRQLPLVKPDPSLGHAADLHRMITGTTTESEAAGLDAYLTTVSDHGMNASTFTARVVASTASDNVSCVVAAIGALKGPLHGGAPGPVLDMLNSIGSAEKAEEWIINEQNAGRRIMGMGHRIYKVRDPRAAIFERAISRLESAGLKTDRLPLARAVEKTAEKVLAERHPDKPLKANVEFYTAVLLDAIRIPSNLFSAMFATGRVAGWLAHVAEQRATGRLIRPASKYTGAMPTTK